jgi:hypothetical protein
MVTLCVLLGFSQEWRFDELRVSEEQYNLVVQERNMAEDKLIDELLFDGEVLLFDKDNKTFYYSIIEGDSSAYNPFVRIEASNYNLKISFCGGKITKESIRNNECIKVIAYDDDYYEEYYLKCTTLPLINIDCPTDLDDMNKSPMQMYLYDNRKDVKQRSITSEGTIHLRGSSSLAYPKNSYRLSLTSNDEKDNNISLLGMRKDDDWILYQAYNDQEKVRNVFSTNLWKYTCARDNSLGVDNGVEYKYIELFLNGEYWGLYALGYPLDELQLEIDTEKGECLYKKIDYSNESDISLNNDEGIKGYSTKSSGEYAWDLLKQYYITLGRKWDDSQSMYEGIDIDNSIDISLFINLIQGLDHEGQEGCMSFKNMYLSVKKSSDKDVILYTPWDMDISWGNVWVSDIENNWTEVYGVTPSKNVIVENGNLEALIANNDENVWSLILSKYHELRENLWSFENLNKMIDEYEDDIYGSGAFRRDLDRWPDGTYNNPDEGLDEFREYVAKRLEKLDEYYDRVEALSEYKNIYITRSAQYEDFSDMKFVYEIDRRKILTDSAYKEFMDYVGIDVKSIPNEAVYAIVDGASKTVEYYDELDNKDLLDNGLSIFDCTDRFLVWEDVVINFRPSEWFEVLGGGDYGVVVEISNHDIIYDDEFQKLVNNLEISNSNITEDTDFLIINQNGNSSIVNGGHNSGDKNDTAIGELSVFYNETGGYGVYINSNECIIENDTSESSYADVRISVMDLITGKSVFAFEIKY